MPSGKVHAAMTFSVATGVLAPYAIVQLNGNPYLYVAGNLVGLLVTPDLDLNNDNYSHYLIRKIFYPAYWIWKIIWKPYNLLIPHRSPISHFPLLGTLLRIGYVFLLLNLFNLLFSLVSDTVSFVWVWDTWFFLGLAHVDTIHFLADNLIKSKEQFGNE